MGCGVLVRVSGSDGGLVKGTQGSFAFRAMGSMRIGCMGFENREEDVRRELLLGRDKTTRL